MKAPSVVEGRTTEHSISGGSQVAEYGAPEESLVADRNNEFLVTLMRWESEGGLTASD